MASTAVLAVAILLIVLAAASAAHVRSTTGYSEIRQQGATVLYDLSLEAELLARAVGGSRRPGAPLTERRAALGAYLIPRVAVFLDEVRCEATLTETRTEVRDGRSYARVLLEHECPGSDSDAGAFSITYGVFADADSVVDDHTNVARYDLGGERGTFVLDAAHRELAVGEGGAFSSVPRFVELGVEHILAGLDHVLFLVVLLLGAHGVRSVVKLASAFTVAHSLTLALAALGWVSVPGEVVEPLIALSIAYVAAENIIGGALRHRLAVVFGFGLLHGLGFASTLSFNEELSGGLLTSLLAFNLGIELGQALIVAALFPLLALIRRYAWSAMAHAQAAAIAATFGLFWFFERLTA